MTSVAITAPAKVNLFLHIVGKRQDGYHLLDSLVAFTEFGDEIIFTPSSELTLKVTGPFALGVNDQDNLVLKAARLLKSMTGCNAGAHISLNKQIPVGAGLGGGSSDAAAVLKGLIRLWQLDVPYDSLRQAAMQLGSDVLACLTPSTLLMRGVGDELHAVTCKAPYWLVLVNPNVPLSTAAVYQNFKGTFSKESPFIPVIESVEDLIIRLKESDNALQLAAIDMLPEINDIIRALSQIKGCMMARMSGSGATCFGLFSDRNAAVEAERLLTQAHPQWWIKQTSIKREEHET